MLAPLGTAVCSTHVLNAMLQGTPQPHTCHVCIFSFFEPGSHYVPLGLLVDTRLSPPPKCATTHGSVIFQAGHLPSVLRFLLLVFIYCACTPARRSEDNCTRPSVVSFRCAASGCWAEDSVWFLGTVPMVSIFPTLVGLWRSITANTISKAF